MSTQPIAEIDRLSIGFPDASGERLVPVVRDVSLTIERDEILGLVGESGSGKTQTSLAILGLTRPPGRVVGGRVIVDGENVVGMSEAELRQIRGKKAAMIFQSPRTSLNPLMKVSDQIGRVFERHRGLDRRQARAAALEMLADVGIVDPRRVANSYPHQLSGGMAQRVMIGMMMACGAELLIADEPTTGLDVTIQAQIFELITSVQERTGMAVLLITHDLGVVAETCDRVAVMQAGRIVEIAPVRELFRSPVHPYTRRLLSSVLRVDRPAAKIDLKPMLDDVEVFTAGGQAFEAVSVDAWAAREVAAPRMIELGLGHFVLAHPARLAAGAGR